MVFAFILSNRIFAGQEEIKAKFLGDLNFDNKTGKINYALAVPAYVRIRTGIKGGPLYKTIVNWQRREAGKNAESCDGLDLSGKFKISDSKDFVFTIHYFPVQEEKGFILGEDLAYHADPFIGRITKSINFNTFHQGHKRESCYDPVAEIKFLKPEQVVLKDGFYTVTGNNIALTIDLGQKDKGWFRKDHFDIFIFIDNVFTQGESEGYLPYNWNFNIENLSEGKHLIVVNLRSLKDHIAVASLPIIIKR